MIHKCSQLIFALGNSFELPETVNCNGTWIDQIEIVKGVPYLIVNMWEYATPIKFCPFCGKDFSK